MRRMLLILLLGLAGVAATVIALPLVFFTGPDHGRFDTPRPGVSGGRESAEHRAVAAQIAAAMQSSGGAPREGQLGRLRRQFDQRGAATPVASSITTTRAGGVAAEWVIAPGADPRRRLLFIHGGGYVMGSPASHRPLASRLSEVSRAAVLSIDYRLMPEHRRVAGLEDCRNAYGWLLENGPRGKGPADVLLVAGDSAGGNLALATVAWARDQRLRAADAVIVFSPQTDATLSSPSYKLNLERDIVQRGSLGPAVTAPRPLMLWMTFLMNGLNPRDPRVSPLLGDLSNLPPILIQASESEMFVDDAVRYANKARTQGSTVVLRIWPNTLHAWQAFDVPEAHAAFADARAFLMVYAP